MRTLELLAPAKDLECGMAAIRHGADAVYIGAPSFGARAAAGNSIEDIEALCQYAHLFGAKVHVTLNTIVYDDELEEALKLIAALDSVGVDALLLQDMGVLARLRRAEAEGHPLWSGQLHASTQCDTRSAEKVAWLQQLKFDRAVLARELSLEEIAEIHREVPTMELEAFVHGALCVCYSGVCYASEYCFKRSANRGACAQFCRMKFTLRDADGHVVERDRHLLSLKDLCQIDNLDQLAEAGACSFKIEGRLKDVDYVKNVVAAYSQRLDRIVAQHPEKYRRASYGRVEHFFTPNLKKTFNRGFTTYFLHGRQPDIFSPDTPKAIGEYVGKVKEIRGNSFNVAGTAAFMNGDGLCFLNHERELEGFRVNRAEGNRLFPLKMPKALRPGMALYRNNDVAFSKLLAGDTAHRTLPLHIIYSATDEGFQIEVVLLDQYGNAITYANNSQEVTTKAKVTFEHQEAKREQRENIAKQLDKLGGSMFSCAQLDIDEEAQRYFIPNSLLSELRQKMVERLMHEVVDHSARRTSHRSASASLPQAKPWQSTYARYPYLYNIANKEAGDFYAAAGLSPIQPAFEVEQRHADGSLLMQCRHCLRYTLGYCVKRGGMKPTWREPLTLELSDGRSFRLEFACGECQMRVYSI